MSSPCTIELRSTTKALRQLSDDVKAFLAALDVEMRKPNSLDRGRRVATAANALTASNNNVRLYSLGIRQGK